MLKNSYIKIIKLFFLINNIYIFNLKSYSWLDYILFKVKKDIITKDIFSNSKIDKLSLNIVNLDGDIIISRSKSPVLQISKIGTNIELDNTFFKIYLKESDNLQTNSLMILKTKMKNSSGAHAIINYNIKIPEKVSLLNLKIKNGNGDIFLYNVESKINVENQNGNISVINPKGSLNISCQNGDIEIIKKNIDKDDSFFVNIYKYGNIDFITDYNSSIDIIAKTKKGKIISQLPTLVNMPISTIDNKFWLSIQKDFNGTINNGGIPLTLITQEGNISILKIKK